MKRSKVVLGAAVLAAMLCVAPIAAAHCDSLAGPVIKDARLAIDKADVTPVLKWVRKADEAQIRAAFDKTLAVRKGSGQARELADFYFFETLVRVHRAGEGAPYSGVKTAAEAKVPACVLSADKAVESGSVDQLARQMAEEVAEGIRNRFREVQERRKNVAQNVEAGREYVASYVSFIHYVEALHSANQEKSGHMHESFAAEATSAHGETDKRH